MHRTVSHEFCRYKRIYEVRTVGGPDFIVLDIVLFPPIVLAMNVRTEGPQTTMKIIFYSISSNS